MAAIVAPSLAVVAWLAVAGALPAWYEIVVGYLVPLYSRLGRPGHWTFYRWHVWIPIAAGAVLSIGSAVASRRFAVRHAVVAVGLGYGVAHYFGQGKGVVGDDKLRAVTRLDLERAPKIGLGAVEIAPIEVERPAVVEQPGLPDVVAGAAQRLKASGCIAQDGAVDRRIGSVRCPVYLDAVHL